MQVLFTSEGMLEQVIAYQKHETDERSVQNEIMKGQIEVQSQQNYDLQRQISLHQFDHHRAASHAGFCRNAGLQGQLAQTVADLSKLVESIARQSHCECESMRRSESPSVTVSMGHNQAVPHPVSGRNAFTLRQESLGSLHNRSSQHISPSRNIYEPRRVESAYNLRNYSDAHLMSRYPSAYDPLYDRSLYDTRHSQLSSQYFGTHDQTDQAHLRPHQCSQESLNNIPVIRLDTHDSLLMKSSNRDEINLQDQAGPQNQAQDKVENQEPVQEVALPEQQSRAQEPEEVERQPIEQSCLPEPQEAALPSKEQQEEESPVEESQPQTPPPQRKESQPYKFVPVQKFATPEKIDVTRYLTHLVPRTRAHKNYGTHFTYGHTPEMRTYSPDHKRWYVENPLHESERPALPEYKHTSFSRKKPLRYYHTLDDEDIVKEIKRLKDWQNYLEDLEKNYRGKAGYNHYGFMRAYTPDEAGRKEKKGAIFNALKKSKFSKQKEHHHEDEGHAQKKEKEGHDNKAWLQKVLKKKTTGGETSFSAFKKITQIVKTVHSSKSVSKTANSTNIGTTGISGVTQDPEEKYEPTPGDVPSERDAFDESKDQDIQEGDEEEYGGDQDAFYEDPEDATQEDQPEPQTVPEGDVFE